MGDVGIIVIIIIFIVGLLLMRLFGAWMLRIDEVIAILKEIRELLKNRT